MATTDLVTGAFGYTGSRIAERLFDRGRRVLTLTRRPPGTHSLGSRVEPLPYDFADAALDSVLAGVDTVYITYWMRFPRGGETWPEIVENVGRLSRAAARAGVRRLVYVSVSNAAHDASTAYFRAKADAEDAVRAASAQARRAMGYAIVRPTLLYGEGDILINNMAWTLRRLPVFGIPGNGKYRVQPVYVEDVADLCVQLGGQDDTREVDAAGPETLTFNELVRMVRGTARSRALITHLPVPLVLATTRLIGVLVRDVLLTRDEIRELMESQLVSNGSSTCPTRLSDWLALNADSVGRHYSSELGRNFRLDRP